MTLKTEIVALAVRVLAENGIIRKPDAIESLITTFIGGETYDRRIANDVVASTDKAVATVKRIMTKRRESKKIIHVDSARV
jgi:hypothetical protein